MNIYSFAADDSSFRGLAALLVLVVVHQKSDDENKKINLVKFVPFNTSWQWFLKIHLFCGKPTT
jgi:hypothetical protein